MVVALAPSALAAPVKGPTTVKIMRGTDVTLTLKIVEYDPGSGFGQVILSSTSGAWAFRPEVGDEVKFGVTFQGTASFRVFQGRNGLPYMKYDQIDGEALVGGKDKVELKRVLFTNPGERGFYIDDIIIGLMAKASPSNPVFLTFSGVSGLLLPAVQ